MRFVSKSAGYSICFRAPTEAGIDPWGVYQPAKPEWSCQFAADRYTAEEVDFARRSFIHRGTPLEEDGVTPADIYTPSSHRRFSTFDTEAFQAQHAHEGFGDDEREAMETFLLAQPDHGPWYLRVPEPKPLPAPWPNYDVFAGTAAELVARVREDGYDVATVVAYERANAARQDVIDALEAFAVSQVDVDEMLISA